ncbi:MAG: tRNA (N(6)-L-threonylcarbamoyladenosine(37)-C(2))-methylthiotransferase MtaB [Firmicutes bacterium]|nr:tRNA (N(6)-L-threonylcarbamoyladenosine(37)-C(2))-methylthiotransferase MtaB [Bacillota bacterium]
MKIAFHTLGCKVNQYETEAMIQDFRSHGYEIVDEKEFADVYVINTCTVTAVADKKSRQYIRRMKKVNPDSIVAVTGCYAQIEPEEVADVKGVDIVTGTNEKHSLPEHIQKFIQTRKKETLVHAYDELGDFVEMGTVASTESRTRAYIKIQEGCNRFCSYCVIPYARGPVRSRAIEDIVCEAKALVSAGYKELVLTGINTAQYDMEGRNLYSGEHAEMDDEIFGVEKAIAAISEIPGDFRIRLSSLEPAVVNSEYVKRLFKYDKLCHHLHMSAQSGSDNILSAMNRPYNLEGYYDLVNTLFDFDPCYGVSTDIIVGFPGEKEADFEDSCNLVRECSFCKTHIFKYSKRPFTKAAEMKGQVSPDVKNKRSDELQKAATDAAEAFYEINLAAASDGRIERVLVEEIDEGKKEITGYTGNYIRVHIPYDAPSSIVTGEEDARKYINQFVSVSLTGICSDGMTGKIVS